MQIEEPIRIISDLHLGHPSYSFKDPIQFAPLFRGVSSVVFNGDSVEIQQAKYRKEGLKNAEALKNICLNEGAQPYFINGNHDPQISSIDHADLANGAVLATHGDMLFHDISPWSKTSALMAAAHSRALDALDDKAFHDFETRLRANKQAVLASEIPEIPFPEGLLAKIAFVLEEFWPPWRPLQIIKCWVETPGRAVSLARLFRPHARFVIIGHTHWSGVWRRGPRVIINTGSFMPLSTRYAVDIANGKLGVKNIVHKNDRFSIGKQIAQFDATRLADGEDS